MTKELIFTIERFPSYQIKIVELYNSNQDFRQLCNDYCLSVNMVEAFRRAEADYRKVESDYKQVSEDLEKEILRFFEKMH